jgi:hypothetical protein
MYLTIAVVLVAIVTVAMGYSIKQLAYGQANMTVSSNMTTATDASNNTTSTAAALTPETLMLKLNSALDDVLGKVKQQDPNAKLSKVECTIDSSWNVQCTISWRSANGGQVSATNLNSSKSNIY